MLLASGVILLQRQWATISLPDHGLSLWRWIFPPLRTLWLRSPGQFVRRDARRRRRL